MNRPYYEALGAGHDDLVRCTGCKSLVTTAVLFKNGCCPKCANRKVQEVRSLNLWEMFKIRVGLIDFPHRKEFLREFKS